MSLLVEREGSTNAEQRLAMEIRPSRRIIVAKPGSRAHLVLSLNSPYKLELRLAVEGLTPDVARYSIVPVKGETPFTARLDLAVNPGAVGIHPFKVIAQDVLGRGYGAENLVLIILPPELPMEVVNHLRILVAFYRAYGIQYVIWYLLLHLFRNKGLSFTEIKAVYMLLKGKKLSNGTIGDLITRMKRKGLIVEKGDRYYAGIDDDKLVKQAIDVKRVKAGRKGAKHLLQALSSDNSTKKVIGHVRHRDYVPLQVRRVLNEAEKLLAKGEKRKALGLLQHTVVGVRDTGKWVIWINDYFIYYEKKAKPPFHYFRSEKLTEILQNMGLKQGFIHTEPVASLISNLFPGGYREARRTHYLLKKLNWLRYGPPLILYIAIYPDGTGGFKLENIYGEIIVKVNYKPLQASETRKHLVMAEEHVDKRNDETYFRYW